MPLTSPIGTLVSMHPPKGVPLGGSDPSYHVTPASSLDPPPSPTI